MACRRAGRSSFHRAMTVKGPFEGSSDGLRNALDAVLRQCEGTIALSAASRRVVRSALAAGGHATTPSYGVARCGQCRNTIWPSSTHRIDTAGARPLQSRSEPRSW